MPAEPSTLPECATAMSPASPSGGGPRWSIVVHGGAGDVAADELAAHVSGCERAAAVGADVLRNGGSAVEAVQAAVELLEDDPQFNAGTGACLAVDGSVELDACIMDGETLGAGAVCALPPFRHPIAIALRVMSETRHALLAGSGAARFACEQGFEPLPAAAMTTERARRRLEAYQASPRTPPGGGTVGAVARDRRGHLAAATSTGGMVGKLPGRVGDSPLIGAGTYADDAAGACSTTGHGESMMRAVLAKGVVDDLERGEPADAAVRRGLLRMARRTGGTGGAIAVDARGRIGLARTTSTMTWAAVTDDWEGSGS